MSQSKSLARWLGEATLVFGSVVGAFYFEDYREDRREEEEYLNTLISLRNDIHDDIHDFRVQADRNVEDDCQLCNDTTRLGYINRYLRYEIGSRDTTNQLLFQMYAKIYDKWRFPSPYYQEISKYSSQLERDSLRKELSTYNEVFISEFLSYESLNYQAKKNVDYASKDLDYTNPNEINSLVEKRELRNNLISNYYLVKQAIHFDLLNAKFLSEVTIKIDSRLTKHGVDTSKLDKRWLIIL